MFMQFFCLHRRVSLHAGVLLVAVGLAHLALSPLWLRYFPLTGHARSISIEFVSGLAVGLGVVLLVSSFGSKEPEEDAALASEQDRSRGSGQNA